MFQILSRPRHLLEAFRVRLGQLLLRGRQLRAHSGNRLRVGSLHLLPLLGVCRVRHPHVSARRRQLGRKPLGLLGSTAKLGTVGRGQLAADMAQVLFVLLARLVGLGALRLELLDLFGVAGARCGKERDRHWSAATSEHLQHLRIGNPNQCLSADAL